MRILFPRSPLDLARYDKHNPKGHINEKKRGRALRGENRSEWLLNVNGFEKVIIECLPFLAKEKFQNHIDRRKDIC